MAAFVPLDSSSPRRPPSVSTQSRIFLPGCPATVGRVWVHRPMMSVIAASTVAAMTAMSVTRIEWVPAKTLPTPASTPPTRVRTDSSPGRRGAGEPARDETAVLLSTGSDPPSGGHPAVPHPSMESAPPTSREARKSCLPPSLGTLATLHGRTIQNGKLLEL